MKGILLAGGTGTRMYPTTQAISKQLIPVYDKPAIYYPLSILMLADIREIAIISTERDLPMIENLLGSGKDIGLDLSYFVQEKPLGIADAYNITKNFLDGQSSMLILGDNFFYGFELPKRMLRAVHNFSGATIFAIPVKDPSSFGVVELDKEAKIISIEEKPKEPKSNWAITGMYLFDGDAPKLVEEQSPSARGELEITDLCIKYHEVGKLSVEQLGRGTAWLDTGTPDSLLSCAQFVKTIEDRQGMKISCIEEIALLRNFINKDKFISHVNRLPNSSYKSYLLSLC